ncbi:MAG TPA: EAL domain-containing protein [Acidimicrobiales bacterium]|nr:EAL domain-containing protein [Acidimicrobiales bacterium]
MSATPRVLIVDDEPSIARVAARVLTRDGHTCTTAASAAQAREILAANPEIELLISDINMPGESGLDLVESALDSRPDLAVIMATGVDDREVARRAIDLGVHGYLVKPYELAELRINVDNALRRRALEESARVRSVDLEQKFEALVQAAPVGVLYASSDGVCDYVNAATERISGRSAEFLLGDGWLEAVHPEDRQMVAEQVMYAVLDDTEVTFEARLLRPDGTVADVAIRASAMPDHKSGLRRCVGVIEDITDRRRFEEQLAHQATHDELTSLPNRHLLLDRIWQALGQPGTTTVMFIDVDRFKLVNDVHGHTVGDMLLAEIGARLAESFRAGETVARFGGDEFVVVANVTTEAAPSRLAERVQSVLAEPVTVEENEIPVSASIGVAVSRGSGVTPEDLLRDADTAMYRAKARGGATYEFFASEQADLVRRRLALEMDLRRALENGEIEVHYQPQVDARTGALRGMEALARWNHPELGFIPPPVFVEIAEESGMAERLTDTVLAQACRQAARWSERCPLDGRPQMSVNLTNKDLSDPRLHDRILGALSEAGLAPGHLTLEVTEGSLIGDLGMSALCLDAMKSMGVRISLDDFGTGYSSLSYLSRLPVDEIKIDRSFVSRLDSEARVDHQLVEAIVNLAAIFGLEVVAEGIETRHQLEIITGLHCPTIQGYLAARPGAPDSDEIRRIVAAGGVQLRVGSGGELLSEAGPVSLSGAVVEPSDGEAERIG